MKSRAEVVRIQLLGGQSCFSLKWETHGEEKLLEGISARAGPLVHLAATNAELVNGTEVRNGDTDLGIIYMEDRTENAIL